MDLLSTGGQAPEVSLPLNPGDYYRVVPPRVEQLYPADCSGGVSPLALAASPLAFVRVVRRVRVVFLAGATGASSGGGTAVSAAAATGTSAVGPAAACVTEVSAAAGASAAATGVSAAAGASGDAAGVSGAAASGVTASGAGASGTATSGVASGTAA